MAPKEALDLFSRIPEGLLSPYLEHMRREAYKVLAVNENHVALHKAQGKLQAIEELASILARQKNLH